MDKHITIIGGGNLGTALAEGFLRGGVTPADLWITRRHPDRLADLAARGVTVGSDNLAAAARADAVLVCVEPAQVRGVVAEVAPSLEPTRQLLASCATGVTLEELAEGIDPALPLVRAMPNTAASVGRSITCVADRGAGEEARGRVRALFELVGRVVHVDEELFSAATVLGACGIAYSMRFVRAASQGGIEIGFDAETARLIAAQTVLGAASLLIENGLHPEREIDRVTTPRGCTIAGLNQMEHQGFSSALIQGITTSFGMIDRIAGERS